MEFIEIDGLVVKLKLQGACGSCPSSLTTMTMGIKRRLMEKIPVRVFIIACWAYSHGALHANMYWDWTGTQHTLTCRS